MEKYNPDIEHMPLAKRLTVECGVTVEPTAIQSIQQDLQAHVPSFAPASPESLHVTLAHLGKPHELFAELLTEVPHLSFETFIEQLRSLVSTIEHALSEDISFRETTVEVFEGGAVVLRFDKTPLADMQQEIYRAVCGFLTALGIADVEEYFRSRVIENGNLYFLLPDRWTPHCTIGYVPREHVPDAQAVVRANQAPDCVVTLTPSYIRNMKGAPSSSSS